MSTDAIISTPIDKLRRSLSISAMEFRHEHWPYRRSSILATLKANRTINHAWESSGSICDVNKLKGEYYTAAFVLFIIETAFIFPNNLAEALATRSKTPIRPLWDRFTICTRTSRSFSRCNHMRIARLASNYFSTATATTQLIASYGFENNCYWNSLPYHLAYHRDLWSRPPE